jgi:hypothetical protein
MLVHQYEAASLGGAIRVRDTKAKRDHQDTFIAALRALPAYEGEIVQGWLFTIAWIK